MKRSPAIVMSVIAAGCASRVRVISGYSATRGEIYKVSHHALDITKDGVGDVVIASADGVVVHLEGDASVGSAVYIDHGAFAGPLAWGSDAYVTGYGHLATVEVHQGQRVTRGQRIGTVGLFEYSGSVAHVHWSLCRKACYRGSETADPLSASARCLSAFHADANAGLVLTYPIRC